MKGGSFLGFTAQRQKTPPDSLPDGFPIFNYFLINCHPDYCIGDTTMTPRRVRWSRG